MIGGEGQGIPGDAQNPVGDQQAQDPGQPGDPQQMDQNGQPGEEINQDVPNDVNPQNGQGLFGGLGGLGLFGGMNNNQGWINSLWNRHKGPITKDDDDPRELRIMKEQASRSNNSDDYLLIANTYLLGEPKIGLESNQTKAVEYYQYAADMGNTVAMYNLAVLKQHSDPIAAYKILQG